MAFGESLVATRVIPAQSVLTPEDVTLVAAQIPGALADPGQAVGQAAQRAIYPGRPIRQADLGPPVLVGRNQTVVLRYAAGGLQITAEGRALDRGGAGDVIRVMSRSSKAVLSARIGPDGTLTVEGP